MISSLQILYGFLSSRLFDPFANGFLGVGTQKKKCPILLYKSHHEKETNLIILALVVALTVVVFVTVQSFAWDHLTGKMRRVILFESSLAKPSQMIRNLFQFFQHLQVFYLVFLHNLYSLYPIPCYLFLVPRLNLYCLLIHHLMELEGLMYLKVVVVQVVVLEVAMMVLDVVLVQEEEDGAVELLHAVAAGVALIVSLLIVRIVSDRMTFNKEEKGCKVQEDKECKV